MEHITIKEILEATNGRLLSGDEDRIIRHLSIDSRTMKGDDLFVPLIGEKADAHRFIEGAFQAGAVATLTSAHSDTASCPEPSADDRSAAHAWIYVADTKQALQDIGSYYRQRLTLPLIGITGSVGKTTTREMVAAALSAGFQVYKTPANHNSQVGVPLTLSEIVSADQIGVLELGMSEPGELTVIARIARVDAAVITNIGVTHIEQLGSQKAIYREKMSIQDGLKEGGILFLNGDDEWLRDISAKPGCRTVYYGTEDNSEYYAKDIRIENGYPVFMAVCREREVPVRLSVMGRHNVQNAMVALAIADTYGVSLAGAAERLAGFDGFQNRQQVYRHSGITIIDDTYNASPVSMKAGLEVLSSMDTAGRRIAVLADMKELGPQAADFHREVGRYLADGKVDVLFTLGELAAEIAAGYLETGGSCEIRRYENDARMEMTAALTGMIKQGDCVLLKGSNSMKLKDVALTLLEQTGGSD